MSLQERLAQVTSSAPKVAPKKTVLSKTKKSSEKKGSAASRPSDKDQGEGQNDKDDQDDGGDGGDDEQDADVVRAAHQLGDMDKQLHDHETDEEDSTTMGGGGASKSKGKGKDTGKPENPKKGTTKPKPSAKGKGKGANKRKKNDLDGFVVEDEDEESEEEDNGGPTRTAKKDGGKKKIALDRFTASTEAVIPSWKAGRGIMTGLTNQAQTGLIAGLSLGQGEEKIRAERERTAAIRTATAASAANTRMLGVLITAIVQTDRHIDDKVSDFLVSEVDKICGELPKSDDGTIGGPANHGQGPSAEAE